MLGEQVWLNEFQGDSFRIRLLLTFASYYAATTFHPHHPWNENATPLVILCYYYFILLLGTKKIWKEVTAPRSSDGTGIFQKSSINYRNDYYHFEILSSMILFHQFDESFQYLSLTGLAWMIAPLDYYDVIEV